MAGVVLQDSIINWTDTSGTTFGTVQTRVVQENTTGILDFYLRIFNDPASASFVSAGRFEDYTGFTTDVDYRLDGLGDVGPVQVKRVGAGGTSVNFVFDPVTSSIIAPGQSSLFLLIKTDARSYSISQLDLLIGSDARGDSSKALTVWSPTAVPEPGTYAMIAGGLVILGVARQRCMRRPAFTTKGTRVR